MSRYRTDIVAESGRSLFRDRIEEFLHWCDHIIEAFATPEGQRDQAIQFHWGQDHDFGDFKLKRAMGDRHVRLFVTFMDEFHALSRALSGKQVLDLGCWTGGTSLLLCEMGASVMAIDEVAKYIQALSYLKETFGVGQLEAKRMSLYA